jgi:WD40 repeat protein
MVCVTGDDGTVRLRRLGDSCPDWELLRDGGYSRVRAATAGRLSDGAAVIVTGGDDGTVRVWRLADTTLLLALLHLPEQVSAVVRGNLIVTAAGTDIAVHQLALHQPPQPVRPSHNALGITEPH